MLPWVVWALLPLLALAGCANGGAGGGGASPPASGQSAMSPAGRELTSRLLRREPRIPEPHRDRLDQALLAGRRYDLWQARTELLAANPVAMLD